MKDEGTTDRDLLLERFPVHKQRQGQAGATYTYVEGEAVIRRLLDATEGGYSWQILSFGFKEPDGKTPAYAYVHGRLTLPGLGSKDGLGTATQGAEDALKSADTDALKRAAVKFGVALYLYDGLVPATPAKTAALKQFSKPQGARKEEEATTAEGEAEEDYAAYQQAVNRFWNAAKSLGIPFESFKTDNERHAFYDRQGLPREIRTQDLIDAAEGMRAFGRAAKSTATGLTTSVILTLAAECFNPPPAALTAITRAMWVQLANYLLDGKEAEKAS